MAVPKVAVGFDYQRADQDVHNESIAYERGRLVCDGVGLEPDRMAKLAGAPTAHSDAG